MNNIRKLLDRFPRQSTIDALLPDGGSLGYRSYRIVATDEEIMMAREELSALDRYENALGEAAGL